MIVRFTDFGLSGPYLGQITAVLLAEAPGVPVLDLFADAPAGEPMLAAYLLAAYADVFPAGCVFLCVVDPGVGSARAALAVEADGRWFVGPDNGLLQIVARRAERLAIREITWRPERLSASFHGRDLFAPVTAMLARGGSPAGNSRALAEIAGNAWPDDLDQIVYIDHFGNAMTGLRASRLTSGTVLAVSGHDLSQRRTFSDTEPGEIFWYENANGLAEIAVNLGRADIELGITPGAQVTIHRPN